MDRLTESKFGLEAVSRSSEFRLGLLARRAGLLTLASWLKHGTRNRLCIRVEGAGGAGSAGGEVTIESIHSNGHEPSLPWLMIDAPGGELRDCSGGAYGKVLRLPAGSVLRAQVSGEPAVVVRHNCSPVKVHVSLNGREEVVELPPGDGTCTIMPARTPMHKAVAKRVVEVPAASEFQKAFIAEAKKKQWKTVAVHTPRWLGVTHSTRILFEGCYPVPNTPEQWPSHVTEGELERHAETLLEAGPDHVVFSGGDEVHFRLMELLRKRRPDMRFDLVFHGNFAQLNDPYTYSLFKMWGDAVRAGKVREFVTVKKGGDEALRAGGIASRHLVNYVPGEVMAPPRIEGEGTHVGIWFSGTIFKSANPMIAALPLVPGAVLHSAGLGEQGDELAGYLGVKRGFTSGSTIPKAELEKRIRGTHLSLYVTSAECSPMLPLESLQLGVPCLIGPCCHLFEDNAFLHERLVVPYPDRPEVIAKYAARAVAERGAIIEEWARYAPQYNARAQELVRRFLSGT